jgi:hypothetical protein
LDERPAASASGEHERRVDDARGEQASECTSNLRYELWTSGWRRAYEQPAASVSDEWNNVRGKQASECTSNHRASGFRRRERRAGTV